MAYEKGKRAWLHRDRGAESVGKAKGAALKGNMKRQPQKEETKRLVPFLEAFGDEPVMVTVTFGEG